MAQSVLYRRRLTINAGKIRRHNRTKPNVGIPKRSRIRRRLYFPTEARPMLIPIQCDVTMFCRANLYGFPLSRE